MKVFWTRRALRRLQQLHDHIALDQPANAVQFVDRLTRRAEKIASAPMGGLKVAKFERDDVRQVFEGQYRIIYRILSDRIDVLTVRHVSRLIPDRMSRL